METNTIRVGDCIEILRGMAADSIDCCVTSPPYWGLRDYGNDEQIGLESTPDEYVAKMVAVFAEVRRVLKPEGTCWLNLGDSYSVGCMTGKQGANSTTGRNIGQAEGTALPRRKLPPGLKPKDLCMIPARVALALRADGWWLRSDIIWAKPNPMPESCKDRPTSAHEHIYLLTKSGNTTVWRHRDSREWSYVHLTDYRWINKHTREETDVEPPEVMMADWRRINLWRGMDYWYDADAISEPNQTDVNFPGMRQCYQRLGGNIAHKGDSLSRASDTSKQGTRAMLSGRGETRNARNVWTIATKPYSGAHFAVFPPEIPRRCILAGCPEGGIVLDPFFGSGTTGEVAETLGRQWVGIELNPEYAELAKKRTQQRSLFGEINETTPH